MSIKITPDVIETTDSYEGYYTYVRGVRVDYPGNYKINVGDIVRGTIDNDGTYHPNQAPYLGTSVIDYDYYTIDLQAGVEYSFAVIGTDERQGDIDLWLYDPNDGRGTPAVWFQEDGLRHADNFTFTPSITDEYTLRVLGNPGEWGDWPAKYELSVTEGSKPSFSLEMLAAAIHHENSPPWSDAYGSGATVSYAFRDTAYNFGNGYLQDPGGYGQAYYVSPNQINAFETCLSLWSESCNIDFNRINSSGYSSDATILVGSFNSNQGDSNTPGGENIGGYAFLPGSSSFIGDNPAYAFLNDKSFASYEGDVWLNNAYIDSNSALSVNSYSFFTIMHEIGHALGLTHLGEYNAGSDPITFSDHAVFLEDTHMYSVMSYFDESYSNGSTSTGIYSSTPMIGDIYIMQKLYGIDTSTRTENNFYGFSNDTGKSSYSFSSVSIPFFTIWDAGGNDTIDASNYSQNQNINLNEGGFSNIGGGTNNISIAYRSIIENATGGSGNDTLTGNLANNILSGGNGNDTLYGGGGNDTLNGGNGNDTLIGGLGDDTYVVNRKWDVVTEASGEGTGIDTIQSSVTLTIATNVENLTLTGGSAINGTGNSLANTITGNGANNILSGGNGNDTLYGGGGNDTLNGGNGNDTLIGGLGDDTYVVNRKWDVVTEASGEGTGIDTIQSSVTLTIATNVENLTLTGGSAINGTGNSLANTITGNGANNVLTGGNGYDTLNGGGGNDTLNGGSGNDTLIGGLGDDVLIGGGGRDIFVFDSLSGTDTLNDFNLSLDKIHFDGNIFTSLNSGIGDHNFIEGAAALDPDDYLIYDSFNLYYDANGSGGGAMIHIATLNVDITPYNSFDFFVY